VGNTLLTDITAAVYGAGAYLFQQSQPQELVLLERYHHGFAAALAAFYQKFLWGKGSRITN